MSLAELAEKNLTEGKDIFGHEIKKPEPDQKKECYFCGKAVTDDEFCSGCGYYVCEDCDTNNIPFGGHNVEDHKDDDMEDDER